MLQRRKKSTGKAAGTVLLFILLGGLAYGIMLRTGSESAAMNSEEITAAEQPMLEIPGTESNRSCDPSGKEDPAEHEAAEMPAAETPEPVSYVSIDGSMTASDTETITLTGGIDELIDNKAVFSRLRYITVDRELELDELEALYDAFPAAITECALNLFGKSFSSMESELDFSNISLSVYDLETMSRLTGVMPRLEKVIMSDCGISDEEMDALNRSVETVDFVWTVHFKVYSVRTDSTYFCCSDLPWNDYVCWPMTDRDFAPLKYCHELVALDLGHENIADLSFLYEMPKLKYLIIITTHNPIDLTPIASLKELYYLEIFHNDFSDLTPLLECPELNHLNIGYSLGEYSKEPLYEMTGLERLWAPGCGLSAEECERIEEALPNTQCFFEGTTEQSIGGGWRDSDAYRALRDELHMFY